ncbi:MAG: radical SAM protein [Candidatus Methanomethylicia archaeon]|nr:radical SAM protein [Candidatus Methanomethylicia archaeon]
MSEADAVVNIVKLCIGNPISMGILKYIYGRKPSEFDKLLKKYAEINVDLNLNEKVKYLALKEILEMGIKSFSISKEDLKNSLKNPFIRRALTNILGGIAEYGVKIPQVTIAPFLIVWNYTRQCNLKCKHCYEKSNQKPDFDELNTEEAKIVLDQLADVGVVAIAFSGGEPLMRRDLYEVSKYAYRKEFYISLATNGTLIDYETALKIKDSGFQYVEVSIDGLEETHDNFRGIKGAWKKSIEGLMNCLKVGLDVGVATTITKNNMNEIPKLIKILEDIGVKRFIAFNFIPVGRGKNIVDVDLTPEEREEILKYLYGKLIKSNCRIQTFSTAPQYSVISVNFGNGPLMATHFSNKSAIEILKGKAKALAEFIGGCGAGRLYCALEPNGDITPCVFMPIKIGNIRRDKLVNIWKKSEVLLKIRERNEFKGCGQCQYKYICGGCRARAYVYFNDLQGPDPGCIINKEYWQKINKLYNENITVESEI